MLKGTHRANLFKWIRMAQEEKSSHSPTTDTFIIVVPFSQIINFVLSDSDMSLCVRLALGSFLPLHSSGQRWVVYLSCPLLVLNLLFLILHVCAENSSLVENTFSSSPAIFVVFIFRWGNSRVSFPQSAVEQH